MRTKYFRTMFHNVAKGAIYSVGVADSETNCSWTAYYMCGEKEEGSSETVMDQRFSSCREEVRLIAASDSSPATMSLLTDFVKKNQVEQAVIPAGSGGAAERLREAGAKHVVELKPGSSLYEEKDFWQFQLHCYGTEESCFLAMYSGPKGIDPKAMDCLMDVKPFHRGLACSSEIDMENHACCMKCSLYNDFEVCKGHNQNYDKGYAAGALLLGSVPVMKYLEQIERDFSKVNEQLRFVSMAEGMETGAEKLGVWVSKSRPELNHYYILPSGCADTEKFIKEVLSKSGRNHVYLTGEDCGVCGSGFFVFRLN